MDVAPGGELVLGHGDRVGAQHAQLAARGPVDAGNDVEQRALPRTLGAHEAYKITLENAKIDVAQHGDFYAVPLEGLAEIRDFNQRFGHDLDPLDD
jgi:hypothetical protein